MRRVNGAIRSQKTWVEIARSLACYLEGTSEDENPSRCNHTNNSHNQTYLSDKFQMVSHSAHVAMQREQMLAVSKVMIRVT